MRDLTMSVNINQYEGTNPIRAVSHPIAGTPFQAHVTLGDTSWSVESTSSPVAERPEAVDYEAVFRLTKGRLAEGGVSVGIALDRWSKDDYVLMPAAAYNGNRFNVSKQTYPPMLSKEERGIDIPTLITDVPRLNIGEGVSKIELRTGDMTTPAVCRWSRSDKKGFILLTEQRTVLGDTGVSLEENEQRTAATITLSAPAVRRFKYSMCNASDVSDDRGVDFAEGDQVAIKFRLYTFDCPDIPALFRYFATVRQDLSDQPKWRNEIPFSAAWEIVEEKYNRENWHEQDGFYRSSISSHELYGQWQTGWVGGGMNTYPMLLVGDPLSKRRSISTLDFLFRKVQAASGFFYGIYSNGAVYGDDFYAIDNIHCLLLRKNADLLYFLGKQLFLQEHVDFEMPVLWKEGYGRACDAFVRLWENNGQFGQFIDIERETILIGGTASAGIAPAGLALASKYWNRPDYLVIAEQAADYYYVHFIRQGVTTGGPGEICQCPDSESAFALLESYVVLYEITGKKKWLDIAETVADLCASWCVSYDYEYPEGSEFKKLDLRSTGAVWASVQNKHAAPGICTLSGDSLLKLYRATGKTSYLDLLRGIAHNLPQYLSREDRPLVISFSWEGLPRGENSPAGRMGERVNTSDWEGKENIGGVDGGSVWCEVSLMLTCMEVPGVYVQKDTGFVCSFDHVDAHVVEHNERGAVLELHNPTQFTAKVKVFSENESDCAVPLGPNAVLKWQTVVMEPHSTQLVTV